MGYWDYGDYAEMSAGHYLVVVVVLVIALRSPALLPPLGSELLRRGRSFLSPSCLQDYYSVWDRTAPR